MTSQVPTNDPNLTWADHYTVKLCVASTPEIAGRDRIPRHDRTSLFDRATGGQQNVALLLLFASVALLPHCSGCWTTGTPGASSTVRPPRG